MIFYKDSVAFERAVLGECPRANGKGNETSLAEVATNLIKMAQQSCPNTKIGRSIFGMILTHLERAGVDTSDSLLLSTLDTRADFDYFTDALFYVPSLYPDMVTIDLFNVDSARLTCLKNKWIYLINNDILPPDYYMNHLYCHKFGLVRWIRRWLKDHPYTRKESLSFISGGMDFSKDGSGSNRPENHFILTPLDTETSEGRKKFAKIVVDYLCKVHTKRAKRKRYLRPSAS